MIDLQDPEIGFAVKAVRKAALLAAHVQNEMVTNALSKQDRSPVTVADYAAQSLLGCLLGESFPQDPLLAEEQSAQLRTPAGKAVLDQVTEAVGTALPGATSDQICQWIDHGPKQVTDRFWTLDPIDGTKGFLRGDQYAVALALVVEGQVQIGVLGCPRLDDGCLVVAARGQGCWKTDLGVGGDFQPLQVSGRDNPATARLLRSHESGHTNVDRMDQLARSLGAIEPPVRMDSQAKYVVLAEGKAELLFRLLSPKQPDYREKIWDQAAGSLVVEEAGGRITDLAGKPLDFSTGRSLENNRGVLASNGRLHTAALEALSAQS